jgi:hypothetical protein
MRTWNGKPDPWGTPNQNMYPKHCGKCIFNITIYTFKGQKNDFMVLFVFFTVQNAPSRYTFKKIS